MDLVGIKDPVEAYETMTRVAQTADEYGYESVWLVDHFHTIPQPSQEVTFEAWTATAALARDTKRVRVGQMVTCNSYRNPAPMRRLHHLHLLGICQNALQKKSINVDKAYLEQIKREGS